MKRRVQVAALAAFALLGCAGSSSRDDPAAWHDLFDGRSLAGWRVPDGASGAVEVEDGRLVLRAGQPMTLLTLKADAASAFPRDGYEVELFAARTAGTDFFVGLTFPVGDDELTLVLGGWGGSLCGLSCLDGLDAASNETKVFRRFTRSRDVRVHLRVAKGRVTASVDGEPIVDTHVEGRRCSLRTEVASCAPLGLATYQTEARIAAVRWRKIAR